MIEATATTLHLPWRMHDQIIRHAWSKLPCECVGLVCANATGELVGLVPLGNKSSNPRTHYWVEPFDQYKAEMAIAEKGWKVAGVYHSHPARSPEPSGTDTEFMADRLMFIVRPTVASVSREGEALFAGQMRCWRAVDGRTEEVFLEVS